MYCVLSHQQCLSHTWGKILRSNGTTSFTVYANSRKNINFQDFKNNRDCKNNVELTFPHVLLRLECVYTKMVHQVITGIFKRILFGLWCLICFSILIILEGLTRSIAKKPYMMILNCWLRLINGFLFYGPPQILSDTLYLYNHFADDFA